MNQTILIFTTLKGVRHYGEIPNFKEENGIMEKGNKEVNYHIRDKECVLNQLQMLCMTKFSRKETFRSISKHRSVRKRN